MTRMAQFTAARYRRPSAVIVAGLAVAAGAALVLQASADRGHRADVPGDSAARPTAAATPAGTGLAAPGPAATAAPGRVPLPLVTGSHLVNGIYTSYPRSQVGAVSAAVEFVTELGSTLEPDRAATVARLTTSPSYSAAAQDAAGDAITARRKLGLQAAGPVPPGTAVLVVPVMYQLRDVSKDQLTVLLLFDYTQTSAADIREQLGVTAARLGWTRASWRLLAPAAPGPGLSALIAMPGTAAAAARGWEAMTGAL
jgi:hypothetical protein